MSFQISTCIIILLFSSHCNWEEIGRTECIEDDSSPGFERQIDLEYSFSANHSLKFIVYSTKPSEAENKPISNNYLGERILSVHEIVAATQAKKPLINSYKNPVEELKSIICVGITKADPVNDDVIAFKVGSNF